MVHGTAQKQHPEKGNGRAQRGVYFPPPPRHDVPKTISTPLIDDANEET
jgi:hypothetical protein